MRTLTSFSLFSMIALSLLLTNAVRAEEAWELKKDAQGIQVYTRKVPGTKFREFKALTVVDAPVTNIIAVLKDAENFPEWMPDAENVKLLHIEDAEQYHYIESPAPWPVSDRDGIYHLSYSQDADTNIVSIRIAGAPEYLPEQSGKVRISTIEGFWRLTPLDNGSVAVHYQLYVHPGGNLPGWLVNRTVEDSPFTLLAHLKTRVQLEQYQHMTYSFLTK